MNPQIKQAPKDGTVIHAKLIFVRAPLFIKYTTDRGWIETKNNEAISEDIIEGWWIPTTEDTLTAHPFVQKADRYNDGKLQWSLVHFKSLEPMVQVLEFGARKYAPHNWKKGLGLKKVMESMMRHVAAIMDGEVNDPETGLPHIGHIMCNAMFWSYEHADRKQWPLDYNADGEKIKSNLAAADVQLLSRVEHTPVAAEKPYNSEWLPQYTAPQTGEDVEFRSKSSGDKVIAYYGCGAWNYRTGVLLNVSEEQEWRRPREGWNFMYNAPVDGTEVILANEDYSVEVMCKWAEGRWTSLELNFKSIPSPQWWRHISRTDIYPMDTVPRDGAIVKLWFGNKSCLATFNKDKWQMGTSIKVNGKEVSALDADGWQLHNSKVTGQGGA